MKLLIRSHNPAWDGEYAVDTAGTEAFRVKTSTEGNLRHIRVFDQTGMELGHVYQNDTGAAGECRGRTLLTVDRRMGLFQRMTPVIKSDEFRWCSLQCGDIRQRDYVLYANRSPIHVYPPTHGIAVEYIDHLAQPLEVLVLVLAVEAIAQYL